MTITKNPARQAPEVAYVDISLADLVGGFTSAETNLALGDLTSTAEYTTAIALPVGAVVVGGSVTVTQVFNSTTSDVLVVGDDSTADRYLSTCNLQALGTTALVPTGFIGTASEPFLEVKWTSGGGVPTTGRFTIAVQYYVVADVVEVTKNVVLADLTSGVAFTTPITLPVGSVIVSGSVAILTAFNSVTSDVIVVGDVTTANRYVASTDVHTGATTPIAFVPTGFVNTSTQSAIKMTWTQVGGSTSTGALAITIRYYVVQNLEAIDLPADAVALSGGVTVTTAFNSATSDALIVGDADSTARYKSSYSIASTGRTALLPTGYAPTEAAPITVRWLRLPAATAPTAGAMRLDVKYLVKGREQTTQD